MNQPDPWGSPAPAGGADPWGSPAPAPADPWGSPAPTAPADPWGSPVPAGGADPWGSPTPADPWGSPGALPGSSFGGGFDSPQPANPAMNQPQGIDNRTTSERVLDSSLAGAKTASVASFKGVKAFSQSLGESTYTIWAKTGTTAVISGAVMAGVGVFLLFLKLFIPTENVFSVIMGSLISVFLGGIILFFTYDKAREEQQYQDVMADEAVLDNNDFDDFPSAPPQDAFGGFDDPTSTPPFDSPEPFDSDEEEEEVPEWDDEDDEDGVSIFDEPEVESPPSDIDVDAGSEVLDSITPGTQTRQFLFELYSKSLPLSSPSFNKWTEHIPGDSDLIIKLETYLREATEATTSIDPDFLPTIESLKENPYIIIIECTKPKSTIKPEAVATEFANIYRFREDPDPETGAPDNSIYAQVSSAGTKFVITLFKGKASSGTISLGDIYQYESAFVTNPKNLMPVCFGTSERGNVWKADFSKFYSLLVSGIARSGKSWTLTSIILQIAMYNSPRNVVFYIGDTKGATSDYNSMNLPHIKHFAGNKDEIIKMMEWFEKEGIRRQSVMEKYGEINYNDLMERHPEAVEDDNMPRLYFILDEIVGLRADMTKEENDDFVSLLNKFVTKFPGYGMYFFGVPHRVVNDVIPKTTYENISAILSILASDGDLKNSHGVNNTNFRYVLAKPGDTAAKMPVINNNRPFFSRGIAMTTTDGSANEQNRKFMEIIRRTWSKLDHEFYHGDWIDYQDRKRGVFDNYECGCVSRGSVMKTPLPLGNATPNPTHTPPSSNPSHSPAGTATPNPAPSAGTSEYPPSPQPSNPGYQQPHPHFRESARASERVSSPEDAFSELFGSH